MTLTMAVLCRPSHRLNNCFSFQTGSVSYSSLLNPPTPFTIFHIFLCFHSFFLLIFLCLSWSSSALTQLSGNGNDTGPLLALPPMGKVDEEQSLPSTSNSDTSDPSLVSRCGGGCGRIRRLFGLRCIFVLLLTAVVFLSALFWLLPHADQTDLDPDNKFKDHDVVATFNVEKPLFVLEDNRLQLENEIFEEFFIPSAKVIILSLEEVGGSNTTKVVFGVDPDEYSQLPPTSLSLMRALFETLVINQSSLRLTTALFGEPFFFEVLKFPGGITIIPPQKAFLLQKVLILFNFTLNFSIHQIQENFNELTSQLKSGLHLAPYENLYVRLWNGRGSTMSAPTIIQSSVLLAVGYSPSKERLKQLAQTINGSHSENLGLNDSVFGRVKQVSLSSVLKPSPNASDGSGISPNSSPSPSPLPPPHHDQHDLTPAIPPSPDEPAKPPGCRFLYKWPSPWISKNQPPSAAPVPSPHTSPPNISPSPELQTEPPAPDFSSTPGSSPPSDAAFRRGEPPESDSDAKVSNTIPAAAPYPLSSSDGQCKFEGAFRLIIASATTLMTLYALSEEGGLRWLR